MCKIKINIFFDTCWNKQVVYDTYNYFLGDDLMIGTIAMNVMTRQYYFLFYKTCMIWQGGKIAS